MAAMDQSKLDTMCNAMSNASNTYIENFNTSVNAIKDAFDSAWVSGSAQDLATEIHDKLDLLGKRIKESFDNKNSGIKSAVDNFNMVETGTSGTNIIYKGFEFGLPNTDITLASALPNGKVGVADDADIDSIKVPMEKLVTEVENILTEIVNTVKGADAFDVNDQNELTSSVESLSNTFRSDMDELKNSLSTRMSNEIAIRDALKNANASNLGA